MSEALLDVEDLTVHHGQLCAVDGVSFKVDRGEVLTMVGANGAGKSTLLRTVAGLHRQTSGTIRFQGVNVTKLAPQRRARLGIALVPEGRRLFPSLTLEENLQVGAHHAAKGTFSIERVYELFDWMPARRRQRAWQFSGGEQQAIAIGRALVANPHVLLLDELSLGLAPIVIERIYALIPDIVAQGVGILLVEQDVTLGVGVANRVHCMLEGKTSLTGTPAELTSAQIERAYFGGEISTASPTHESPA
ncbi:MAG: ABC transporter ATP-binding protein [Acidimicrobiales bacterium]|jgi:branched-chain amino acid transport system ATP-binding protein